MRCRLATQTFVMNDSFDVSTIVFAALAVFVVWKLRSVLGTRTGEERPPFNPFVRRAGSKAGDATAPEGKVIPLPTSPSAARPAASDPDRWKGIADPQSRLAADLDRIQAADPSFSAEAFLSGARAAYEMILAAFAKGDRAALAGLLAADVLDGFKAAIAEREARGETVDHTFVSLDTARITHAQLAGTSAQIGVRFESHQINAARASGGALAEGGRETVDPVVDDWTFGRTLSSRDPNWTLVATTAE
jgi:predicted lipid-binding transport protein (Tim44 family)